MDDGSLVLAIASNLDASEMDAIRVEVDDFVPPSFVPRSNEDTPVATHEVLPLAKPIRARTAWTASWK